MSSEQPEKEKPKATGDKPDDTAQAIKSQADNDCPPAVVTHHEAQVDGRTLAYTVTTGLLPIRNEAGDKEAEIFFMAYAPSGGSSARNRPLMFSFNGGPGSSSVWLHLGALGPRRARMRDDGSLPAPPYQMEDNPLTWLDQTDLVFIDPVGTGYSRPVKAEDGKKFWNVQGDVASVGEFIRLYLTRYQRWSSPLFLVGESYGTTRAAGLSDHLIEKGIALNGIVLVSSVLNFQTLYFAAGNDLPYILFLPTYAATAWYHRKSGRELQDGPETRRSPSNTKTARSAGERSAGIQAGGNSGDAAAHSLAALLGEVEAWAETEYAAALAKGDALSAEARKEAVERLARYTGLEPRFIEQCDLRIEINRFCKELLRDEGRTVGRLDSRIDSAHTPSAAEKPDFDPSMTAIRPPYTALFNDYVRRDLGYETDREYYILGGGIKTPWDWGNTPGYIDTSEALGKAFAKNPYMKLFVASGYYDLATPYFATRYTLSHMGLAPQVHQNIRTADYEAGHMMYIHTDSLRKLKSDVADFLRFALASAEPSS